MKRTELKRKTALRRGPGPKRSGALDRLTRLVRTTRLRWSGKSKRFAKRRDRQFSDWVKALPCLICGGAKGPSDPAHVAPRSRGSDDRGNIVPLCRTHHEAQEGKTAEFERENSIDLDQVAFDLLDQYLAEHPERDV